MDKIFTLDQLSEFYRNEKKELQKLGLVTVESQKESLYVPQQTTIDFILNYSKSISVRKSKILGCIEFNLN